MERVVALGARFVIAGSDVSDPPHIGGQRLSAPPLAAEDELHVRRQLRGAQEELLNTFFTVGQTVADKGQIAYERRIGRFGMMRVGI